MNQESEDLPDVTEEEVNYAITKIKNHRTPGEDSVVIKSIFIAGPTLLNKIQHYSIFAFTRLLQKKKQFHE